MNQVKKVNAQALYFFSGTNENGSSYVSQIKAVKEELSNQTDIVITFISAKNTFKRANDLIISYINQFTEIDIRFSGINLISQDTPKARAQNMIQNSNVLYFMGGNQYETAKIVETLGLEENIFAFKGVIMGTSAGAMYMGKTAVWYTYPNVFDKWHTLKGLGLANLSVIPHLNNQLAPQPFLDAVKKDKTKIAKEKIYLLENDSFIKIKNGQTEIVGNYQVLN